MPRTCFLCGSIALNAVLAFLLLQKQAGQPVRAVSVRSAAGAYLPVNAEYPMEGSSRFPVPLEMRRMGLPVRAIGAAALAEFEYKWSLKQADIERRFDAGEIDLVESQLEAGVHDLEADRYLQEALGPLEFRAWKKETLLADFSVAGIVLSPAEAESAFELRQGLETSRRALEASRREGTIDASSLEERMAALESDYQGRFSAALGAKADELSESKDGAAHDVRVRIGTVAVTPAQFTRLVDIERARRKLDDENLRVAGGVEDAAAREASVMKAAQALERSDLNNEH